MNYKVRLYDSYDLKNKIPVEGIMYLSDGKVGQLRIKTKTEDLGIAEWITKGWIFDVMEEIKE